MKTHCQPKEWSWTERAFDVKLAETAKGFFLSKTLSQRLYTFLILFLLHPSIGGTAQATCKLRRNFLTPKHFASERQLQPLRICQNPDPPQDLEVHIILSKGVAPRYALAPCLEGLTLMGGWNNTAKPFIFRRGWTIMES